jgi:hypothetical protein
MIRTEVKGFLTARADSKARLKFDYRSAGPHVGERAVLAGVWCRMVLERIVFCLI